jgi:hypothetical protein
MGKRGNKIAVKKRSKAILMKDGERLSEWKKSQVCGIFGTPLIKKMVNVKKVF